ncbi:MAG: UDP-N-acetylmuramoyl-L-alanine--D-glutamate ligase [Fibrobacter sp.]|nr:UDP-N-acetylmuramoyl-L-alanine--D-glutamate ligase [Fibrobacter sp.]
MQFDFKTSFPKSVSIIGAARSGLAAALYFLDKGTRVFISDSCSDEKLKNELISKGLSNVEHESGCHSDKVLNCDLIILSPGVPSNLPILIKAKDMGIPVWSEMELGFRVCKGTFLAITGSTGKSTTVSLLGEALKAGDKESIVAGNIGIPVISLVPALSESSFVAAEVSSFQLENIDRFHPKAAAVLNFMKNHLDRYDSEDDYYNAKKEIARNFTKDNYLVVNADDPRLVQWARQMQNQTNIIFFGGNVDGYDCFWPQNGRLYYRFYGTDGSILNFENMFIKGGHNHANACAAAALAKVAGVSDKMIEVGFCRFKGLEHRLEYVSSIGGVSCYNDSKSTTAESMLVAVSAFPKGVQLIAGGRDKGCDFSVLDQAVKKYVKNIILIGEAAERMEKQWSGLVPVFRAQTLREAVNIAFEKSTSGDTVVFSPGCSSFDMFKNYEERGSVFRELVNELGNRENSL